MSPDLKVEFAQDIDFVLQSLPTLYVKPITQIDKSHLRTITDEELRKIKPGDDLSNTDLSGRQLSDLDLRGVNFSGSDLTDADCGQSNLTGASFVGAVLTNTDFSLANCTEMDLTRAVITNAQFYGTTLHRAVFDNTEVNGGLISTAELPHSTIHNCVFERVDFWDANVTNSNIQSTQFINCRFNHTSFARTLIRNTTITGAKHIPDEHDVPASACEIDFRGAAFDNFLFEGELAGADFTGAKFLNLSGSSSFVGELPYSIWDKALLRRVALKGLNLANSTFAGTTLEGVTLDGANLLGADLATANVTYATADGALVSTIPTEETLLPQAGESLRNLKFMSDTRIPDPGALEELGIRGMYREMYSEDLQKIFKGGSIDNIWDAFAVLGINPHAINEANGEIDDPMATSLDALSYQIQTRQRSLLAFRSAQAEKISREILIGRFRDADFTEKVETFVDAFDLVLTEDIKNVRKLVNLLCSTIEELSYTPMDHIREQALSACKTFEAERTELYQELLKIFKGPSEQLAQMELTESVDLFVSNYQEHLPRAYGNALAIITTFHGDTGKKSPDQEQWYRLASQAHGYLIGICPSGFYKKPRTPTTLTVTPPVLETAERYGPYPQLMPGNFDNAASTTEVTQ